MKNQLPTPRSIANLIEEKTNFISSIGDGHCIGGEIEGFEIDSPIYIDWAEDTDYYHVNYNKLSDEEQMQHLDEGMKLMEQLKAEGVTGKEWVDRFEVHQNSAYFIKNCYSVEELIETLNSIK